MACATRFGFLPRGCSTGFFSPAIWCTLGASFLCQAYVLAQDSNPALLGGGSAGFGASGAAAQSNGISLLGYVLTILLLLAAGLAVIFRGNFPMAFSAGSKAVRKLRIEETKSVGHRQYLLVAEYEGRRFLLGVCPGRIEYLSGLDSDAAPPGGSFQELLQPKVNPSHES
jgi:flagellar protein FliO/FliZ